MSETWFTNSQESLCFLLLRKMLLLCSDCCDSVAGRRAAFLQSKLRAAGYQSSKPLTASLNLLHGLVLQLEPSSGLVDLRSEVPSADTVSDEWHEMVNELPAILACGFNLGVTAWHIWVPPWARIPHCQLRIKRELSRCRCVERKSRGGISRLC